jgi:DeoR/GlpR family transcriptional regulator of sugar metabolism
MGVDAIREQKMSKANRQSRIIVELRAVPSLRVYDLSARLAVSAETIRRDLAELDQAGQLSRTYGGAMRPIPIEPVLAEREGLMVAERELIANAAASQIEANDILMIGGGATTLHFARRVAVQCNHLTIITHAFSIAMALATNPSHKVLMLPGQYDGREGVIYGPDTIDALLRFRCNKAVLGASGLTREGPNDAAIGPGSVYGAMMRRAAHTIILADHTKFNRASLSVFGTWSPDISLISDVEPDGELALALADHGTKITVAVN